MTDRNKQYNFFIFFTDYYVDTKYLKCPAPVEKFVWMLYFQLYLVYVLRVPSVATYRVQKFSKNVQMKKHKNRSCFVYNVVPYLGIIEVVYLYIHILIILVPLSRSSVYA
jgi:hypothetical protein